MVEPCSIFVNVEGEDHEDYMMDLPPGFRFHPTDEEIISHYLTPKVMNGSFSALAVGEVDLNKSEPWDLPMKAKMGEKEWYFFCQRDRKYPTGMRTNRATESGYWKATGKDKEIYKKGRGGGSLIGMKKTLVFYKGRAPKGEKTNWVMHEYRLEGHFSYYNLPKPAKDEWVVSRVFHKNAGMKRSPISGTISSGDPGLTRMNSSSFVDDLLMDFPGNSMPPLIERPTAGNNSSLTDGTTEEDDTIIKGTSSSPRSSHAGGDHNNYLSYFSADDLLDTDVKNHFMPYSNYMSSSTNPTPDFHSFYPQIPLPVYSNFSQASQNLGCYSDEKPMLLRALAMKNDMENKRKLKMEQLMSVSHEDTTGGLSSDNNVTTAETSSFISKKDSMGISSTSYEDQFRQDPDSDNLDYLWNF